ncbi:hypothetical protein QL285_059470 [Trifolium repens]|nr:hypothetical protein QL285_059470 [Trifolium repens]
MSLSFSSHLHHLGSPTTKKIRTNPKSPPWGLLQEIVVGSPIHSVVELVTSPLPPPPPPSMFANFHNMDEGLRQGVSSIDLEGPLCFGVDERSRIQQLENDVAKDKKSLEHAATREGTLKKKLRQPELKREIDSC